MFMSTVEKGVQQQNSDTQPNHLNEIADLFRNKLYSQNAKYKLMRTISNGELMQSGRLPQPFNSRYRKKKHN